MQIRFFIFIALFILHYSLQAQKLKKTPPLPTSETEGYVSVAMQLNAFNYFGDIPSGPTFTRPGLSVFLSRKISPKIHARLGFAWGRLVGDDNSSEVGSGVYARNLHFRNDIKELSVTATYDFLSSPGKHPKRKRFTPYFFTGLALIHHNPRAKIPDKLGNEWTDLQALGTEGQGKPGYEKAYNKIQIVVPLGLGLKWKIDKRWDFGIESGLRLTFFDYLDDVSGNYPDLADLGNPLAAALSNRTLEPVAARSGKDRDVVSLINQYGISNYTGFDGLTYATLANFEKNKSTRGNPNSKDLYFVSGIHLSYIVNVGLKCPQFR